MSMEMPTLVNHPGTNLPEEGPYYLVVRDGLMMHIENDWLDALIPVKRFLALEPAEPYAKLKLPPIPGELFAQVLTFFREIYRIHRTEAAVLLHYGPEVGWGLSVPQQDVAWDFVHYDMSERIEGMQCVGTMHSHGNLGAYHSSTDVRDEAVFDGVHITLGDLHQEKIFSMSAEVVVRGERFSLDTEYIEGVRLLRKRDQGRPRIVGEEQGKHNLVWRTYQHDDLYLSDTPPVLVDALPQNWFSKVDSSFKKKETPHGR